METVRPLRAIVRKLVLPVAVFACLTWLAVFWVIFRSMPNQNLAIDLLIGLGGLVLLFPWVGLTVGMMRRLGAEKGHATQPEEAGGDTIDAAAAAAQADPAKLPDHEFPLR